jgi:DNA repair photolyase
MGFWSINPYVGCEFGCKYCYARFAHRYAMGRKRASEQASGEAAMEAFERQILVKRPPSVLAALDRDLARVQAKSARNDRCPIIVGTATDPYQPAERRFGVTKVILERLLGTRGLTLGIITKSPLICRDIDLLVKLSQRHSVTVYISLISTSVRITKLFEARSPMPHTRLRALGKLRRARIKAGINCAPVLPGITDSLFQIEPLMTAACDMHSAFVHPSVVRLYPAVRSSYLSVIAEHFPSLISRYRVMYRGSRDASPGYVDAVRRRFQRIARKHGLSADDPLGMREERQVEPETQLSLL